MSGSRIEKQSESVSSAEEALKRNTDCVYFLASPLTCRKGAECEYRHCESARFNPTDCHYWLNGNCLHPKCRFRHPPLEGLLGNQKGAPAGSHPGLPKQALTCVFFQRGLCMKGDMCSFLHTPLLTSYKKQHLAETKPVSDPQFSKKLTKNHTGEKKSSGANLSKANKADVDISAGLTDTRDVDGYVPNHVDGYEPVVQQTGVEVPSYTEGDHLIQEYESEDNDIFLNGNDEDNVSRESSSSEFEVIVANRSSDTENYNNGQGNSVNVFDPYFDKMAYPDQCFYPYHPWEDEYALGYCGESPERGYWSEQRVYEEEDNIPESDLRYRLGKQMRVNGMRSVGSHEYAAQDSSMERGYRDSCRYIPRESSISSNRLQIEEYNYDRRNERGLDRSELSQVRFRDRSMGRFEENYIGNQERGFRGPWARRQEIEDERNSGFSVTKSRKEEDHNHHHGHGHKQSEDSFAGPLPFSEILKRKRAAASGGDKTKVVSAPKLNP